MNQQVAIDGIEERLRAFAASPDLSPGLRDQAQRYLTRLVSPVRVTLLGRPSPLKTALLPAAIGEEILPPLLHPPTLELRFGEVPTWQITGPDGTVTEFRGELRPDVLNDAILAVVERPAPLLRRLSFLEVQADDAIADQRAAIAWAAPRTDIALWCSARYDDTDQALWAAVPDQIKDHAYLILTDCAPGEVDPIRDIALDEFHDTYAVDVKQEGGASGVDRLVGKLLDHARLGRQADADGALLFIRAQEQAQSDSARRPTRPRSRPLTRPLAPSGADEHPANPAAPAVVPVTAGGPNLAVPAYKAPAIPAPEPVAETDAATATRPITRPRVQQDDGERELYSVGLRYIRRRSAALLSTMRASDEVKDHLIAAHCGETLVHLSEMLTGHETASEPEVAELTDTVMEAESLVILMENERGEEPALDALAILLQVRQGFESRLAA